MKNVRTVFLFFPALVFISCRKTHTCECITTNLVNLQQVTTTTEMRDTRKNAEERCSDLNKNEGDFNTECSLK